MLFAQHLPFDISNLTTFVGNLDYLALALVALWGTYCVFVAWRRVGQLNFKLESHQYDFLAAMHEWYLRGDVEAIRKECQGDQRAVPQLVLIALRNMSLPAARLRDLLIERFQRDVLVEIDNRTNWVNTVVKSAPMLGLFGTVIGMMGAFSKLGTQARIEHHMLASDIMFALITTAIGLTIAVPLIFATAALSIRTARLEDFVSSAILNIVDWKKGDFSKEDFSKGDRG